MADARKAQVDAPTLSARWREVPQNSGNRPKLPPRFGYLYPAKYAPPLRASRSRRRCESIRDGIGCHGCIPRRLEWVFTGGCVERVKKWTLW